MLAVVLLDREHLDNGAFLKSLAKTLPLLRGVRILFVHADSDYTDRVMQLGMMREQALARSTRELNRRVTALFNDEGNICVGLNGFQRNVVVQKEDRLVMDGNYLRGILQHSHVVLSNLAGVVRPAGNPEKSSAAPGAAETTGASDGFVSVQPHSLLELIESTLEPDHIIVFSISETAAPIPGDPEHSGQSAGRADTGIAGLIPQEMNGYRNGFLVAGLRRFAQLPDTSGMLNVGKPGH